MKRALLTTRYRTYFTVTEQASEFIGALADREWFAFVRRTQILDLSLATGRPPVGVSERVDSSSEGLWELRVTRGRGPHIRFLYIREGDEILIVRCLRKREPRLKRREIRLADRDAREWRKRGKRRT
jgi:putative component of toxin-antitoxin plasmid stabilization module